MNSSEERRNNPELREDVKKFLDEQAQALKAAKPLLDEALKTLTDAGIGIRGFHETSFYDEAVNSLFHAQSQLNRAITYSGDSANETYVGNAAASGFGKYLQDKATRARRVG